MLIVRIRAFLLWRVCIVLLAFFVADVVYSAFVPNTGKGITSAASTANNVQTQDHANLA